MKENILRILGFDLDQIPPGADWEFVWTFTEALQGLRIFLFLGVMALLVYSVFAIYRRESNTAPMKGRIFLGVVRTLVLIMLAIVLLGPAIKISEKKTRQDVILVLVDDSLSMLTDDRYLDDDAAARVAKLLNKEIDTVRTERPNRAAIINHILQHEGGKFIADLTKEGNVRVQTFAAQLGKPQLFAHRGDEEDAGDDSNDGANNDDGRDKTGGATDQPPAPPTTFEIAPSGQGTNIASAVREAIKSMPGTPIAAVIVITDGQNTAREADPLDAAEFAAEKNVPVLTLGVGDPSRKRNLRVAQATANENVRKNNPFQVQAQIESQGLDAMTVNVELVATRMPAGGDGENVLQSRQISFPASVGDEQTGGGSAVEDISFEYTPKTPGDYEFAVRVQQITGESNEDDNLSRPIRVTVRSDKSKILLVSGGPTWEYRTLMPLLQRDSDVDLSVWLQTLEPTMRQEGNTVIDHLPATPRELYEYSAVIMLDPDPREFNEAWVEALRTFLGEHGGGLLYMPGPKYATTFLGGLRTAEFRDLLPVRFGDMGALDVKALIASHTKEWPLQIVPAQMDHPIMRFDTTNPQFNEAVWGAMPGIYWSFPAQSAKPAARTLIEHSNPAYTNTDGRRPLLVSGLYGPGPIVYLGLNGTWRWRRIGNDSEFYEKFWMQTINFLIQGRDRRGSNRGQIDIASTTFNIGDRVPVTAKLYDPSFLPMETPTVEATLRAGLSTSTIVLEKVPDQPGMYKTVITPTQLGDHRLEIQLDSATPNKPAPVIAEGFDVALPRIEMEVTRLNKQVLNAMADLTRGQYFDVDEWQSVVAAVPDRSQTIVVARKPYELWSTERLLILLVILLTIEWAMRKRFKLM